MQLFEYAVVYEPNDDTIKSKIIQETRLILANDAKHASILAARAIPEEFANKLDEVEIILRPF